MSDMAKSQGKKLTKVVLDPDSLGPATLDQEHERSVAIYDLIEENFFAPVDHDGGPYALHLSLASGKLSFDVRTQDGERVIAHLLSLTPLRRVVRDYFLVCNSYYAA